MASSSPALLLNNNTTTTGLNDSEAVSSVVVHPLVLLSILDHHTRRQNGAGRVIGTLLGRRDGEKVEVTNCFAVPHAERDEEVAIGKDFNRQMLALHLRANRNETVVGWYATAFPEESSNSRCLANTSSLIHEFYTGEIEDAVMDSPVHLVVDTSLIQDSIGLKGYISSTINLSGEPLANMFHEVGLSLKSSESERIVVDEMIRAMSPSAAAGASEEKKEVEEQSNSLQVSMEKLLEMLEVASEYVGKVVDGEMEADDVIGNQIADTLSSVPRIRPEVFDKMFNDSMQDLLMVSYLSNVTRTQLNIAEKLNKALDQEG
jgi:translation initiation factor 3 subunit F